MKMKRSFVLMAALLLMSAVLLSGCNGKPLPEGMEEDALLDAGREVLLQLVAGDYETVRGEFRSDVADTITAEDIQEIVIRQLDGAGAYKQIKDTMVTGRTANGNEYGEAVFYCEFAEKNVIFRIAFDPDMVLIGLDIRKQ